MTYFTKNIERDFGSTTSVSEKVLAEVKKIVDTVRCGGDAAIRTYTKKFDGIQIERLEVDEDEINRAYGMVKEDVIGAMKFAAGNIKKFATAQLRQFKDFELETSSGVMLGYKIVPIKKVGAYVPGGNYPLPSVALMTVTPAKIAGVKEVIVCSPPKSKYGGIPAPETLVAADIAGADRIFKIGGPAAIAAMAYGTESVPAVDKIVGPGNKYVVAAKKLVYGDVGIDFLAGPSEVLIIADESANSRIIAADLLAQAEHDVEARVVLVTNSTTVAREVKKEIARQLKDLPTKKIAAKALKNKGKFVVTKTLNEAIDFANKFAPEHLELQVLDPKKYLQALENYGSLFLGDYAPVALGDYGSGTNSTLPTSRGARYTGGLSVKDFIKIQTYQYMNKKGCKRLKSAAIKLAEAEGLAGHKKSLMMRD